jgi:hypothetical protein
MFGVDNDGPSLRDFIDENQNLLTAIAVLVAIAAFVAGLSVQWLGKSLLFLSIAAIVTVWTELFFLFPKTGSLRLMLFKNILSLFLLGFVTYWFLAFGAFWSIFSFLPLFVALVYMTTTILKQLAAIPIIQNIFGKHGHRNIYQRVLVVAYAVGVGYGYLWIFAMSVNAAPAFAFLLEMVRINFK